MSRFNRFQVLKFVLLLMYAVCDLTFNSSADSSNSCPQGMWCEIPNVIVPNIGPLPMTILMPPSNLNYEPPPIREIAEDGFVKGRVTKPPRVGIEDGVSITSYEVEDIYGDLIELKVQKTSDNSSFQTNSRIEAELDRDRKGWAKPDIKKWERGGKEKLGKRLFTDKRLSATDNYPCSSCHISEHGFADENRFSAGVDRQVGKRNTPSLYNVASNPLQFWDGRAHSLEEQSIHPLQNRIEMAMTAKDLVDKLRMDATYQRDFKDVFGHGLSLQAIAEALAAYERTIISTNSPFDKYITETERAMLAKRPPHKIKAFAEAEQRGMNLFRKKARCILCHNGPNFTDNKFHNVGYPVNKAGKYIGPGGEVPRSSEDDPIDLGRYKVTQLERDKGAFKTPSLRSISETPPYMHDGKLPDPTNYIHTGSDELDRLNIQKSLKAVVDFFNKGGGEGHNPYLDPLMTPLKLSDGEVNDLVAFLMALKGDSNSNPATWP